MKIRQQIRKLQDFLDSGARKRKTHKDDMKTLLHKMKLKEKRLLEKSLLEFDKDKLSRLRKEIDMLHAQRLKGIKALKAL
jgi:hypothetical protein